MTQEECKDRIEALFEQDGMLDRIREGELDTEELDELAAAVGFLNTLDLTCEDRGRLTGILWEFAFHVLQCIMWHWDQNDTFTFANRTDRELRALKNMLYWLSNRFTYKKELRTADLYFAGYMRWEGSEPNVPFDPGKTN